MLLEILIIVIAILLAFYYYQKYSAMKSEYDNLIFEHRSMYVKHGKVSEQLFPFMKDYPYNPSNFRFIGSPIDGINFEDDKIVFIEFKTGKSNLTDKQKRIKSLVENKKVSWHTIDSKHL
ncbi:MAG TPA: Holliday junction resolvase-like protein [Candidatus Nanoarchaeia archaeon]|nr:Holliday junction resolvase-like protein [Candidatus Nanoarchaeia archaeon]